MQEKQKKLIGIICAVLTLIGAGYLTWGLVKPSPITQVHTPVVDALVVRGVDIVPQASFVAKIESKDSVGLRARVTGFLQERLFLEGDLSKKDNLYL